LKAGNGPGAGADTTPLLLRALENYAEHLEATNGEGRPEFR